MVSHQRFNDFQKNIFVTHSKLKIGLKIPKAIRKLEKNWRQGDNKKNCCCFSAAVRS